MIEDGNTGLDQYNSFCKKLKAGSVLYNIDSTNFWGNYLLVANILHLKMGEITTYVALLIGLKKDGGQYIPTDYCASLTPDNIKNIPFLKPVGYCKFKLLPNIEEIKVDKGLVAVYSSTDLHKFAERLSIRKPRAPRYGKDGRPLIKRIKK